MGGLIRERTIAKSNKPETVAGSGSLNQAGPDYLLPALLLQKIILQQWSA
jgi:hypothetical protein